MFHLHMLTWVPTGCELHHERGLLLTASTFPAGMDTIATMVTNESHTLACLDKLWLWRETQPEFKPGFLKYEWFLNNHSKWLLKL